MKSVLIIGASGYLGSNLMEYLRYSFYTTGLDRVSSKYALYEMDFTKSPDDIFTDFDVIICVAADSFVPTTISIVNNVSIATKLLHLSEIYPDKRFIYLSTDEILSTVDTPYARSKIISEKILEGSNILRIRPSNLYGEPYTQQKNPCVIPYCYKIAKKLCIHGDGKQTRRFTNIRDLLKDIQKHINTKVVGYLTYKNGVEVSMKELIEHIASATGKEVEFIDDPRGDKQDANFNYPDSLQTSDDEKRKFFEEIDAEYL